MRPFFTIDMEDYDDSDPVLYQPASRGIIWKNGKLALIRSVKYGYYKFPGGGVEEDETREETGLEVIRTSIHEYGMSKRREKGIWDYVLDQDSYYYICDVSDKTYRQKLTKHEKEAKFILEYADPETAIEANERYLKRDHKVAIDRDTRVLRILAHEH